MNVRGSVCHGETVRTATVSRSATNWRQHNEQNYPGSASCFLVGRLQRRHPPLSHNSTQLRFACACTRTPRRTRICKHARHQPLHPCHRLLLHHPRHALPAAATTCSCIASPQACSQRPPPLLGSPALLACRGAASAAPYPAPQLPIQSWTIIKYAPMRCHPPPVPHPSGSAAC